MNQNIENSLWEESIKWQDKHKSQLARKLDEPILGKAFRDGAHYILEQNQNLLTIAGMNVVQVLKLKTFWQQHNMELPEKGP